MHRLLPLSLCASLASCSALVQYSDEISDARTGRSAFVTTPAELGGSAGFLIGIPADILALPVTYSVYLYQEANDPITNDPLSTLLFPSFVCWRAGKIVLGGPFDLVEWATWRAWSEGEDLSPEQREEIEYEHDQKELPSYPVEPIYPDERWIQRALGQRYD